ncbi:copper resistance CopC family protein [Luteimicrobium subarcticum]|uniref:CopC domain-containing protein n=1 Tax=Luteimicrobium subarcticum TaxID=620910 RepID=A0A2M8WRP3_9MICO|nr:copper resistance CopC family protein [Luteimicrobium subarcticum]PJI93601.1 hypothetical protein CLV34_1074 [Luteimicrobium subarcticum]
MTSRVWPTIRRRGLRAAAAGVVALAAAALAVPAAALPAMAHDYVVSTSPTTGSTVTKAVPKVSVTFDDVVLDPQGDGSTTVVQVTDGAGKHYETGCPAILDRTISADTALGAAGSYLVTWRAVSADGHPVSGTFSFRYQPPADAVAAPGADTPACGKGSGSGETGSATGAAASVSGSSGVGLGVVAALVGVVVLAGAAVVVLAVVRRRSQEEDVDAGADAT